MTPEQIEDVIERTAVRTAEKLREEFRALLGGLGFNMDPNEAHEEQQMVALLRSMHQGTRTAKKAIITAGFTALVGWMVYLFQGWKPHP